MRPEEKEKFFADLVMTITLSFVTEHQNELLPYLTSY